MRRLQMARVAIFGLGGVGSFAAEAVARAGVGSLLLIDADTVSASNINRQLIALMSTVGRKKAEVMRERILDINPDASVAAYCLFYCAETAASVDISNCDYVIDAMDTVSSKLLLIETASRLNVPIVSCMGAGNKLNSGAFEAADIFSTSVCPLARVMRRELKARGIGSLRVVYSKEPPITPAPCAEHPPGKLQTPGSISFVPGAAGLMLAGEAIKHIALGRD